MVEKDALNSTVERLRDDVEQAYLELKWLEDEMKRIAFWSTLSIGLVSATLIVILLNWD